MNSSKNDLNLKKEEGIDSVFNQSEALNNEINDKVDDNLQGKQEKQENKASKVKKIVFV